MRKALIAGGVLVGLLGTGAVVTSNQTLRTLLYCATGTGAVCRSQASKNADVVSVKDFCGDTIPADATSCVQAAITQAATLTGGSVFIPPVTSGYSIGTVNIPASTGLTIYGAAKSRLLLVGVNAGFRPVDSASITGLTIRNLEVVGENTSGRSQSLFQVGDTTGTVTLRDARFLDNRIKDTNIGISVATGASGDVQGVEMSRNYLENIVGAAAGTGYGLQVGSPSSLTAPIGARIIDNTIKGAGRHAIYASFGWGVIVENNTVINHGTLNDATTVAIFVGRGGAFTVRGNQVLNTVAGPPDFGTGDEGVVFVGDQGVKYALIENNQFLGGSPSSGQSVYIGTSNPSGTRPIRYVTFKGNTINSVNASALLELLYGKDINIEDNYLVNAAGSATGIKIDGTSEGAGTTTYSDRIHVRRNTIDLTGGDVAVRLAAAAAAAGTRIDIEGNVSVTTTVDMFVSGGGSSTNPNIFVDRQTTGSMLGSGLTWRWAGPGQVSADRGDASVTLLVSADYPVQRFATALTVNRTVTLSTTGARSGDTFRVVRTGLGAFTLDVGGLKTIPSATAAFVDVVYDGSAWRLAGYGAL